MIKKLSIIVFVFILSCNNENVGVTEKEVDAVQQVLNFYGGECMRHKGFSIKNGVRKRNFELEMSKSSLLENSDSRLNPHSANIAYLFYSNLGNEKSNYEEIKVKINLSNGKSSEFVYSDKELKVIENLQGQLKIITGLILAKDYDNLAKQFDESISIGKSDLEKLFSSLESKFGGMKETQFQGFEFKQTAEHGELIIISEALVFEKMAGIMNMILKRDNAKLLGMNFL